nr:D,D-dipeptide ABC transporter permease [Advenella kashmirensis]
MSTANTTTTSQLSYSLAYFWYQLRRSPMMLLGLLLIILMCLAAILAPLLTAHDPNAIDLGSRLLPPSAAHFFGTDEVGRDLFSRVLYGARQSIGVGIFVAFVASAIGSVIGCFSGVIGRTVDTIIMRTMDIVLSVPSLVLTMALAAALGPSLFNAMIAITIVRIPYYVRLARGQTLSIREMAYVQAAKTFGAGRRHIVRWHVLRNALPPVIVQMTLDIGNAILMAAALGFIGLGAQQPTAEWGAMIASGRNFLLDQWWYSTFPGVAILITAIGFNLVGDGVRDMLDPKQKVK